MVHCIGWYISQVQMSEETFCLSPTCTSALAWGILDRTGLFIAAWGRMHNIFGRITTKR